MYSQKGVYSFYQYAGGYTYGINTLFHSWEKGIVVYCVGAAGGRTSETTAPP